MQLSQSWPVLVLAMASSSSCAQTAPEVDKVDSGTAVIRKLVGTDDPVWAVVTSTYRDRAIEEGTIVFRPYRSSEGFCRAYAMQIVTPAHACMALDDCPSAVEGSYNVSAHAYLADMAARPAVSCDDLDFSLDYFRLENDWLDLEVADFVSALPGYFKEWRENEKSADDRACDWTVVTPGNIESFDIVSGSGSTRGRFILRNPCTARGSIRFDHKVGARASIVGYEATEIVVD